MLLLLRGENFGGVLVVATPELQAPLLIENSEAFSCIGSLAFVWVTQRWRSLCTRVVIAWGLCVSLVFSLQCADDVFSIFVRQCACPRLRTRTRGGEVKGVGNAAHHENIQPTR